MLQLVLEDCDEAHSQARHLASYYECMVDDIADVEALVADEDSSALTPEFDSIEGFRRHYWY